MAAFTHVVVAANEMMALPFESHGNNVCLFYFSFLHYQYMNALSLVKHKRTIIVRCDVRWAFVIDHASQRWLNNQSAHLKQTEIVYVMWRVCKYLKNHACIRAFCLCSGNDLHRRPSVINLPDFSIVARAKQCASIVALQCSCSKNKTDIRTMWEWYDRMCGMTSPGFHRMLQKLPTIQANMCVFARVGIRQSIGLFGIKK